MDKRKEDIGSSERTAQNSTVFLGSKQTKRKNRHEYGGPFHLGEYLEVKDGQRQTYEVSKRWIILTILLTTLGVSGVLAMFYLEGGVGGAEVAHWVEPFVAIAGVVGAIVTISGFIVSIFIWEASKRAEVAAQVLHGLTKKTAQSQAYFFSSFSEHIDWLNNNLRSGDFSSKRVELSMALSTPLYGAGSRIDRETGKAEENCFRDVDLFLDWLDEWITAFAQIPQGAQATINLLLWPIEGHRSVFLPAVKKLPNRELKERFYRLVKLLTSAENLSKRGKIVFNVYVAEPSDTRMFFVNSSDEARGLKAVFTPLTDSSIQHHGWEVSGYSVMSPQGGVQMKQFFHALCKSDHSKKPNDVSLTWKSPEDFLLEYFPMFKATS